MALHPSVPVNTLPLPVPGGIGGGVSTQVLQYDDGTAAWLTWAGTYRGVWFNPYDFGWPVMTALSQIEYWFFEHASNYGLMWDTAEFYSEIWMGAAPAPEEILLRSVVTALHYAPCYHIIETPLEIDSEFWCIVNTEMSSKGSPTIMADGTGYGVWPPACRSFYSYDMTYWEPWSTPDPSPGGDFLVRAHGQFTWSLHESTWGSVKSLFR